MKTPRSTAPTVDLQKSLHTSDTSSPLGTMDVTDQQKAVTLEEAVSLTGQGRFHWTLQVVCGLCLTATIVETLNTGYVLPSAQCDLQLSTQDKGLLNAVCYVGMICSSHLWGFLADTRGRRFVLLLTLLADSACTVLSSFSHVFWLLLIFRFCNGFFICGAAAVVFAYLGEFHGEATRARAVVWLGVSVAVGTIALPGLAWLVIPQTSWRLELPGMTYGPWRIFLDLCTLPGLSSALFIWLLLPESPKFLLAAGKEQRALTVLRNIYATNTGKDPLSYPALSLRLDAVPPWMLPSADGAGPSRSSLYVVLEVGKAMWRQTAPLLKPPHLRYIVITCLIDFAIFACSNGFLLWLPELFSRMTWYAATHPDLNSTLTVCQTVAADAAESRAAQYFEPWLLAGDNHTDITAPVQACSDQVDPIVFRNTLAIGGATAAAYILAGYLVPFVGKRNIIVVSTFLSGGCGVALHWAASPEAVLTLACFFMAPATMCISVINSVVIDLFPTQLRAMAVCLTLMMGRLGTGLGSLLIGTVLEISCSAVFFILSGVVIGCGILALLLPGNRRAVPKDVIC